jgi:hypothetical protein
MASLIGIMDGESFSIKVRSCTFSNFNECARLRGMLSDERKKSRLIGRICRAVLKSGKELNDSSLDEYIQKHTK